MEIKEIISNSHLAFLNQENKLALSLAEQAIKMEEKIPTPTSAPPMRWFSSFGSWYGKKN